MLQCAQLELGSLLTIRSNLSFDEMVKNNWVIIILKIYNFEKASFRSWEDGRKREEISLGGNGGHSLEIPQKFCGKNSLCPLIWPSKTPSLPSHPPTPL